MELLYSLMQLSLNSVEKMRYFAKEEPLEYLKAFFWHAFVDKCMLNSDYLLISQLMRPLV